MARRGPRRTSCGSDPRGQIAGQYADARGPHACLFDRGRFTTIDPPGGGTVAVDINDRGEILLPAPDGFYVQSTGTPGPLA